MSEKTALIAGATGLIGTQVLQMLLESDHYEKVVALSRRVLPIENKRLVQVITGFGELDSHAHELRADDVYCCLGTTMKKAGSKEQVFKIDHDYPLKVAEISRSNGAGQYLMVSALGADKDSLVHYNKVKGQVEASLMEVGFPTLHIFRPSLLLGPREEKRVGEDAAKSFFNVFNFLFVGPLKRYKAIDASKVAKAMVEVAQQGQEGVFFHESASLQRY